jgi:hypothetical protein
MLKAVVEGGCGVCWEGGGVRDWVKRGQIYAELKNEIMAGDMGLRLSKIA